MIGFQGRFKKTRSITAVKTGAMVAKTVALATDVNFKAPKKQAKCNPKKIPANSVFFRLIAEMEACGLNAVHPQRNILAVVIRQKAMETAAMPGRKRANNDDVLTANKARSKRNDVLPWGTW